MYLDRAIRQRIEKASRFARELLVSGLTPRKLALTICLGTATGSMPLLWGTSVLCAAWATLFRLNQAAIQAVNYCCYPLQLALFLPLCRLGELLFPWGPRVTGEVLKGALHGHIGASLSLIGWASLRALGVWLITAVPLTLLAYPVLEGVLRRKLAGLAIEVPAAAASVLESGSDAADDSPVI